MVRQFSKLTAQQSVPPTAFGAGGRALNFLQTSWFAGESAAIIGAANAGGKRKQWRVWAGRKEHNPAQNSAGVCDRKSGRILTWFGADGLSLYFAP